MDCSQTLWTPLKYLHTWQRMTYFSCVCVVTVLTLLSNTVVVWSIIRTHQSNNVFCRLVFFLSLSDCSLAFNHQTLTSMTLFRPEFETSCIYLITSQFFVTFFVWCSWFIIIATAIERMTSIKNLQLSSQSLPMKKVNCIGMTCILLAILTDFTLTVFTAEGKFNTFDFITQILGVTGLLLIFLSYNIVYRKVRCHVREAVVFKNRRNVERSITANRPVYLFSTAKVIKRILTALFVAYVPYIVLNLSLKFSKNPKRISWISFGICLTYVLVYFNSVMNAAIFINGNKKCQRFIKLCMTEKININGEGS